MRWEQNTTFGTLLLLTIFSPIIINEKGRNMSGEIAIGKQT